MIFVQRRQANAERLCVVEEFKVEGRDSCQKERALSPAPQCFRLTTEKRKWSTSRFYYFDGAQTI